MSVSKPPVAKAKKGLTERVKTITPIQSAITDRIPVCLLCTTKPAKIPANPHRRIEERCSATHQISSAMVKVTTKKLSWMIMVPWCCQRGETVPKIITSNPARKPHKLEPSRYKPIRAKKPATPMHKRCICHRDKSDRGDNIYHGSKE